MSYNLDYPEDWLNTVMFCDWCKRYAKYCDLYQPPTVRYSIGVYQVSQGIGWKGTDSECESYAAAAIHMVGATEMICKMTSPTLYLPLNLSSIGDNLYFPDTWETLMLHVGSGLQMVFYGSIQSCTKRNKRFSEFRLSEHIGDAVRILFSLIPYKKRQGAIETAVEIMTGKL